MTEAEITGFTFEEVAGPIEGDTQCIGYDLYTYTDGEWVLTEANSTACGYTTPAPDDTMASMVSLMLMVMMVGMVTQMQT